MMMAFKKFVTVEDSGRVVLSGLPFRPGQRVEIVMIAEEDQAESTVSELRQLLRGCQAVPAAVTVTEDQIAEEIAAYRAGR